jgi:TetR/AcrR family transcriptional repressor of nem operon
MARPREFDPDTALDSAMHVFWEKGYEATSMADLVETTGVHRASLYGAFGNKEDIFVLCLDRYGRSIGGTFFAEIAKSDRPLDAIKDGIRRRFAEVRTGRFPAHGCLLANTAAETTPASERVFHLISEMLAVREQVFHQALTRAREMGQLRADADPLSLARYLNTFLLGISLQVRTRPAPEVLEDTIERGLEVVG